MASKQEIEALREFAALVGSNSVTQGSKVKAFIKRNRERNKALYLLPDSDEGTAFIVCPVLKVRTLNIKKKYIEGVLNMTVDAFKEKFPDAKLSCKGHASRIATGLTAIDEKTGLTKHKLSAVGAKATLSKVGKDGLTGYARKGLKTKETHEAKIDENGLNGYERLAQYRNDTLAPDGRTIQQVAREKSIENQLKKNGGTINRSASKLSKDRMADITKWITDKGLKYYFDDKEYALWDRENKRTYLYDLVIPELKICFEYQSNAYHPSMYLTESEWKTWMPVMGRKVSSDEKSKYDTNKARLLYNERNFLTWFIWEGQESIPLVLQFLEELYVQRKLEV